LVVEVLYFLVYGLLNLCPVMIAFTDFDLPALNQRP
jgi:hypothetical protein